MVIELRRTSCTEFPPEILFTICSSLLPADPEWWYAEVGRLTKKMKHRSLSYYKQRCTTARYRRRKQKRTTHIPSYYYTACESVPLDESTVFRALCEQTETPNKINTEPPVTTAEAAAAPVPAPAAMTSLFNTPATSPPSSA